MCLYPWECTINHNKNEDESEKRSHRYDINRRRPRHGHKYNKYKICLSMMMLISVKQQLSNTKSSIHEKVKQHWGWAVKSVAYRKRVLTNGSCITNKTSWKWL